MDLALFFENLIRLYLSYNAEISFKNIKNEQFGILIFSYFVLIELIWFMGVNNRGTASRHHIPSVGLLVLCTLIDKYKNENNPLYYENKY